MFAVCRNGGHISGAMGGDLSPAVSSVVGFVSFQSCCSPMCTFLYQYVAIVDSRHITRFHTNFIIFTTSQTRLVCFWSKYSEY